MAAELTVLNPVAQPASELGGSTSAPQRPPTLEGLRIGLFWNRKPGGNFALQRVGELLQQRYPGIQLHLTTPLKRPIPEDLIPQIRGSCDVVVGTTADWGSCTSYLAHDMIELEKVGLPTVAMVARGFEDDFRNSARVFGLPQLPYVVVPYPMTGRNREEAATDVEGVFDSLVHALVTQPKQKSGISKAKAKVLPAERERFEGAHLHEGWERFNHDFMDRGLGDGFPLIAPTPQLVEAFLKAAGRDPLEVVGYLVPGNGVATVEKIAINAAMAGCEPEHLPILIAAVQAIHETPNRIFPARSIFMSTSAHALMLLVNGPIVKRLGINYGRCTLGPGKPSRVNTVLGRALRLIQMNVGHAYPGEGDMSTIGTPLKYSMCLAENEDQNPWEPFHVERGFQREQSTVTVFGTTDSLHIHGFSRKSDALLMVWASRAAAAGGQRPALFPGWTEGEGESHITMLMCPDHARTLAQDGHTKKSIREFISKNANISLKYALASDILTAGGTSVDAVPMSHRWILQMDPDTQVPTVSHPHMVHIVVVGGPTGKSDLVRLSGQPTITKEIVQG